MPKKILNSIFLSKIVNAISGTADAINLYSKSDGFVYIKNVDGLERNISTQHFFNSLSTPFPTIPQLNTTRVNITNWNISVIAGISYEIKILATYNTGAANTGGSMGIITSGGAIGNIHGYYQADILNTTVATALRSPLTQVSTLNTLPNSFMTSTGMTTSGVGSFECQAIFNCTASGNLIVQWGTEVANNLAQLRVGSSIIVRTLN